MKTNWIILVSSLAFPIKMEIIFAGGEEREQELTIITVGESSAMKNDFFSPLSYLKAKSNY